MNSSGTQVGKARAPYALLRAFAAVDAFSREQPFVFAQGMDHIHFRRYNADGNGSVVLTGARNFQNLYDEVIVTYRQLTPVQLQRYTRDLLRIRRSLDRVPRNAYESPNMDSLFLGLLQPEQRAQWLHESKENVRPPDTRTRGLGFVGGAITTHGVALQQGGAAWTEGQLANHSRQQLEEHFYDYLMVLDQIRVQHPLWWQHRVTNHSSWRDRMYQYQDWYDTNFRRIADSRLKQGIIMMSQLYDRYEDEHNVHNPPPGQPGYIPEGAGLMRRGWTRP